MTDERKVKLKRVTYFDDLAEVDQITIEKLLSKNIINQLVQFKNANGNHLTCFPYKIAETECLIVLDKKKKSKISHHKSSFKFDPLSDRFNLDYDLD